MDIDTMKQTEFLVRTIRDTKRKIVLGAIAASVVSVLLFLLGSYYLLFRLYDGMTRDYYTSLLHGVSSFQTDLISAESTIDDLERITGELSAYRGVREVWFADRFGRLVFSTDGELLAQFENRRLPSEYFENVQHIWSFENGRPVPKIVPVTKFLVRRLSIPVYPFRKGERDFVMGIDVNRFVDLPGTDFLLYLSAGYFVIFSALLFFPLFFWTSNRLGSIIARAPMIFGPQVSGVRAGALPEEAPPSAGEGEQQAVDTPEAEARPPAGKSVLKEGPAPADTPRNEASQPQEVLHDEGSISDEAVDPAAPDVTDLAAEVVSAEDSIASFMERKKELFMHEDVQLPFVNASCYVHNSSGMDGSYTYTHRTGEKVYFISFLLPYGGVEDARANLDGLLKTFNERIGTAKHIRDFARNINELCLENDMRLNLSVIAVETEAKSVRYSAFGSGRALYLKSGQEEAKELELGLPELGAVAEEAFSEHSSFADIRFQKNDLFVMLPQDVFQPDAGPKELFSGMLLEMREKSAFECSMRMGPKLRELSGARQTGLVTVKFL